MIKTRVNWQFNKGFKIQKTFSSRAAALRYVDNIKELWKRSAMYIKVKVI